MKTLRLAIIHCDSGTQCRSNINEDVVSEYAECLQRGDEFPPLDVFFDGTEYHLADGFHRVMAASRIQREEFDCNIHKGTALDALWFGLGANRQNGLRMSLGDKRKAIEIALAKFPDKSQQEIADHVGCDQSYVSNVKKDVMTSHNVPTVRKDSKGRKQPTQKPHKHQPEPQVKSEPSPAPPDDDDNPFEDPEPVKTVTEPRVTEYYDRLQRLVEDALENATRKQLVSMSVYAKQIPRLIKEKLK